MLKEQKDRSKLKGEFKFQSSIFKFQTTNNVGNGFKPFRFLCVFCRDRTLCCPSSLSSLLSSSFLRKQESSLLIAFKSLRADFLRTLFIDSRLRGNEENGFSYGFLMPSLVVLHFCRGRNSFQHLSYSRLYVPFSPMQWAFTKCLKKQNKVKLA